VIIEKANKHTLGRIAIWTTVVLSVTLGNAHIASAETRGSAALGIDHYLADLRQVLGLPQDQVSHSMVPVARIRPNTLDVYPGAPNYSFVKANFGQNQNAIVGGTRNAVPELLRDSWARIVSVWRKHPMPIALVAGFGILLAGLTWFVGLGFCWQALHGLAGSASVEPVVPRSACWMRYLTQ